MQAQEEEEKYDSEEEKSDSDDLTFMSPEMREERERYQAFLREKIAQFKELLDWEVNTEEIERLGLQPDRFQEEDCIADAAETYKCILCVDKSIASKP